MGEEALLVIDMLNDFLRPQGNLYIGDEADRIISATGDRLADARNRGLPVIYICDRHRPDDAEFRMFPAHAQADSWGSEIVEELAPAPGDIVIPKRRFSGFAGTDLDITLRERGIQHLFFTGCLTNICVLYTAADARNLHYQVTVCRDCVASNDQDDHRFALRQMEKVLGCHVA